MKNFFFDFNKYLTTYNITAFTTISLLCLFHWTLPTITFACLSIFGWKHYQQLTHIKLVLSTVNSNYSKCFEENAKLKDELRRLKIEPYDNK